MNTYLEIIPVLIFILVVNLVGSYLLYDSSFKFPKWLMRLSLLPPISIIICIGIWIFLLGWMIISAIKTIWEN